MLNATYVDLHVHTHLSPCGKPEATAAAMVRRARAKGLSAMGFADHLTPQRVPGCSFYDRQRPDRLRDLRSELAQIGHVPNIEILVGVEADYTLAGKACLSPELVSAVDHIVCASSHFHLPAAPKPALETPRARADLMLCMAKEALQMPYVSIWAHPFDCSQMRPLTLILQTTTRQEWEELIALANAREIALEVNGGPARLSDYRTATQPFFELASQMDARFTVTSDAHHPDDLDRVDLALEWAGSMGIVDRQLLAIEELLNRQRSKTI
jgi:putative hydrolase